MPRRLYEEIRYVNYIQNQLPKSLSLANRPIQVITNNNITKKLNTLKLAQLPELLLATISMTIPTLPSIDTIIYYIIHVLDCFNYCFMKQRDSMQGSPLTIIIPHEHSIDHSTILHN